MKTKKYRKLALVGFSLGGNITLKYIGELSQNTPSYLESAAAISVPCDLQSSAINLTNYSNWFYQKRFLISMQKKFSQKQLMFPDKIIKDNFKSAKNLEDFDNLYTAPAHGFKNAQDYWEKCSSLKYISKIKIPTLLINAKNDPFLSKQCFPYQEARSNPHFFLETPESGGHVGFISFNIDGEYWHESRVAAFMPLL